MRKGDIGYRQVGVDNGREVAVGPFRIETEEQVSHDRRPITWFFWGGAKTSHAGEKRAEHRNAVLVLLFVALRRFLPQSRAAVCID